MRFKRRSRYNAELLLREVSFTFEKAWRLFLFSLVSAAIGLGCYVLYWQFCVKSAVNEVTEISVRTFESLAAVSHQINDSEGKSPLISSEFANFSSIKKISRRDLDAGSDIPLLKVKGQRRKLSSNLDEVRFVKTGNSTRD